MSFEQFFTPYAAHNLLPGKRVLVLAPHPDDEVFGCGGALAQLTAAGVEVRVLVLTDGVVSGAWADQPSQQAERLRREQGALRRAESCAAAALLGYPAPVFMGLQDGALLQCDNLAQALAPYVSEFKPQLLLAPSVWEMHRDHRAVAQAALDLLRGANLPYQLAFYEVGVPLPPNYLVDISPAQSLKTQAMLCFPSQLAEQAYAEQIEGLNRFRSYTLGPAVTHAEAYYLLDQAELQRFAAEQRPDHHSLALLAAERQLQQMSAATSQAAAQQAERLMQVQGERAGAVGELERAVGECRALAEQNTVQVEALRQARESLALQRRSMSWRLTAPLRWCKALWRRCLG